MPDVPAPPTPASEDFGHPRGTLAVVLLFALIFALGWLAMYFYQFLAHGAPTA
jgi:hypothetical protein